MPYPTNLKSILAGETLARQRPNQFRTSLNRHIDNLIEEEECFSEAVCRLNDASMPRHNAHEYAASLLRELRAWIETGS